MMPAVENVNEQSQRQPDHEAQPGNEREPEHQPAAQNYRDQREPRHKWHAERTLAIGLFASKKDDAQRNQHEGEQRPDIGDAADLANIGTLFAFVLVSLGVIFLRRKQPDRKRSFRVPFVPWFPVISVILCGGLMFGLTLITWLRFVIWLALGLLIYVFYSRHHSEFCKTK